MNRNMQKGLALLVWKGTKKSAKQIIQALYNINARATTTNTEAELTRFCSCSFLGSMFQLKYEVKLKFYCIYFDFIANLIVKIKGIYFILQPDCFVSKISQEEIFVL